MNILIIIGICVAGLVALIVIIGMASPQKSTMEKSININASVDQVFPQLNSLKNFVDNWSPWTEKDPNAKHEYNDIAEGKGALYSWAGEKKKVGEGSMEIIESVPNQNVRSLMKFKGMNDAYVNMMVKDNGDGTVKVTWDFEGDNGNNPMARIFGRFIEKFLGPDYTKGLNNLKAYCEKQG